jgi:ribonucleoside-triphosphate reductase
MDVIFEDEEKKPIITPQLIFNITQKDLKDSDVEGFLLKVHDLAFKRGTPYFVNHSPSWQKEAMYSASGNRLSSDWTNDWELDTIRTGNLGCIILNLPRLAYEAEGKSTPFFHMINDYLAMVIGALKGKYQEVEKRMKSGLLPTLTHKVAGDPYFRIENAPLSVELVGLNEATKIMIGEQLHFDRRAVTFALKLIEHINTRVKKIAHESRFRITLSLCSNNEAAHRLAELDREKYDDTDVFVQGLKAVPHYTALTAVPLEADVSLEKRIEIESAFHPLLTGGHLSLIEVDNQNTDPEALLNLTKKIFQSYDLGSYTFTKKYSYCRICQKTFDGYLMKCPQCKSMKGLMQYVRPLSKYLPIDASAKSLQKH